MPEHGRRADLRSVRPLPGRLLAGPGAGHPPEPTPGVGNPKNDTRPHDDLEIGVAAGDFAAVRAALADHEFDVVGSGHRWPLHSPAFARTHQTWVRDPASGAYRLAVFREPHDGDMWIFRRDETLRLPYSRVIAGTRAVPHLAPEIVLLFKAKNPRPKDQSDFEIALPALGPERRVWLRRALTGLHPEHDWLGRL
jgi:hypothetical protein